jgi:G3E family GTPase
MPDGHHRHADDIRTLALSIDERIDWARFGLWLTMLLNRHGEALLRVKGILNVADAVTPVAVHAVQHLVHTPRHLAAWPDQDRRSRLIFIARGLDPAVIERSFRAFVIAKMKRS